MKLRISTRQLTQAVVFQGRQLTQHSSVSAARAILRLLRILLTFTSLGFSAPLIYVTDSYSNKVDVIDIGRRAVIAEIPLGTEPFGLAFSRDGRRAYIANAKSTTVSVVDATKHQVIQTIKLNSKLPVWAAVSPDGSYVYVTNEGSHDVSVLSVASGTEVGKVRVGHGPAGIAVSPDGYYAYVANEGTHDLSVIDLLREVVIKTIAVGSIPQGVAITQDGARVYVANFGSDSVSVISTASNTVISEVSVQPAGSTRAEQGPTGIAASPDAQWIYTANFKSGYLSVIDARAGKAVATAPIGVEAFGVAADPGGNAIYVVGGKERQLSAVDPKTFQARHVMNLTQGSFKLAVMPERGGLKLHDCLLLIFLGVLGLLLVYAIKVSSGASYSKRQLAFLLGVIFLFALSLRVVGLNWGIPDYDAETARVLPSMRTSFHLDEDNFLWNLTRVRPEAFDFHVADFHWGTLQYYLVEIALLVAESTGIVSKPWRESFLSFNPDQYARLFITGRAVSAILGSCSIFLAYAIGKRVYGKRTGIWAALTLSLLPLHVVNSHYLTSDISMTFFLLLAFYGLLTTFARGDRRNYLWTGIAFGLAITAKYNAIFFLPVVVLAHLLQREHPWSRKAWSYVGAGIGFVLGEPYALIYHKEFWETLHRLYLNPAVLPTGSAAAWLELTVSQLKNIALFGIGIPLVAALILVEIGFSRFRFLRTSCRDARSPNENVPSDRRALVWASLICLFLSVLYMQLPMIRYTLPVIVFASILAGHTIYSLARHPWGRVLACGCILATGLLSFLQLRILVQEHTVNQAFHWIERHVPPGATLIKGWPEIPVLNSEKYRLRNYYTANRAVDFKDFFTDPEGRPFHPDYVLLDNLTTLDFPDELFRHLEQHYSLAAEFKRNPQFWRLTLPEWYPPHDWKYSHPEIRIYRKKANG